MVRKQKKQTNSTDKLSLIYLIGFIIIVYFFFLEEPTRTPRRDDDDDDVNPENDKDVVLGNNDDVDSGKDNEVDPDTKSGNKTSSFNYSYLLIILFIVGLVIIGFWMIIKGSGSNPQQSGDQTQQGGHQKQQRKLINKVNHTAISTRSDKNSVISELRLSPILLSDQVNQKIKKARTPKALQIFDDEMQKLNKQDIINPKSDVKEANILVLCADKTSIESMRAINIIQEFCNKTLEIGCQHWNKINIYYSGMNLSHITISSEPTLEFADRQIPIVQKILPDEVGNLKKRKLPEYIEKTLKKNLQFFDIIINEFCPIAFHLKWTLHPKDFEAIFSTLKPNGFFISITGIEKFKNYPFQKFKKFKSLKVGYQNWIMGLNARTRDNSQNTSLILEYKP